MTNVEDSNAEEDSNGNTKEQFMTYMEDSNVEEDSDSDVQDLVDVDGIEQSTKLCCQRYHLLPTQVCNQIGWLVASFPTPPTAKDTKNRDSDAITVLEQMFLEMKTSTTKFCLLSQFLQKFLNKANLLSEESQRKKQVIEICSTIIQEYLKRLSLHTIYLISWLDRTLNDTFYEKQKRRHHWCTVTCPHVNTYVDMYEWTGRTKDV